MDAKSRGLQYKTYLKNSMLLDVPHSRKEPDNAMMIVNHYVIGPSINGFVLWVLREAIRTGKKRLYFLARDGYFMYRVALDICEVMQLEVECRYLECSRYAIRIPLFAKYPKEAMEYICRHSIDVNMTKILKRAGLNEAERAEVFESLQIDYDEQEVIPYAELDKIKAILTVNTIFQKHMKNNSNKALPNLLGYITQEGLLEDVNMAIVDSGWTGTMQKNLDLLIELAGGTPKLEGYYWGLYEIPLECDRSKWHCYYFAPENNLSAKVYFSNCLFEAIIAAPHGMALGYEYKDNRYIVIEDEISNERETFVKDAARHLADYTNQVTKRLVKMHLEQVDFVRDRKVIGALLKLFMGKPDKAEVDLYGNILFSDDVLEDYMQPVAGELNEAELSDNHLFNKVFTLLGGKNATIRESAWYEGSAVRVGKNVRWHLYQYATYKYLLYLKKRLWRRNNA